MAEQPHSVGDILDRLADAAEEKDQISIGQTVEAFGHRSYGPFLVLPALLELSPIGGIPGIPTFLAAIIMLFAFQILLGRRHFWLPDLIARRSVSAERLDKAVKKLRPVAGWLDRWFHGRLSKLTGGPFVRIAAGLCILLALTIPPLELVPFASSVPMLSIAAFGMALLVRDGLLMIVACLLAVGTAGFGIWLVR